MRILILGNREIKKNSYAENLLEWLLTFLSQHNTLQQAATISEAKKISLPDHAVLLVENHQSALSFFDNIKINGLIKKHRIDCLIQFAGDKIFSASIKQLIVPVNPETIQFPQPLQNNISLAASSHSAEKKWLLTYSNLEKNITVFHAAAKDNFEPISWSEKQSLKMQYSQGQEYFLVQATHQSLDSFLSLLKAFSGFKKWQHSSMKLIVAGRFAFFQNKEWQEKLNTYRYRDDLVFVMDKEEYAKLLAGAYAFIHILKRDDDVIPLLQSMKCGTPCLSFQTETITEYAGEAAIMIDNNNYDELSQKMILLYKDENLRSRLIEFCGVQTETFSKEKLSTSFSYFFEDMAKA